MSSGYPTSVVKLTRTVRFACNSTAPTPDGSSFFGDNGYAGAPALVELGRFDELEVSCSGTIDPVLQYLIDIKAVDRAVRHTVIPILSAAFHRERSGAHIARKEWPGSVMADFVPLLAAALGGLLHNVVWKLTPFMSLTMHTPNSAQRVVALLRQRFEFAASHRLHVPTLSIEENRRAFGKCNHESGHGHNYIFEPCVELPVGDAVPLHVGELERIAKEVILDRFDHKYLNIDTAEFREGSGAVPSVENIARVFFELLAPRIDGTGRGAKLRSVTVWESDRTSATFPAE